MRLALFTGASTGTNPATVQHVRDFSAQLARRGVGIVYGGGQAGLMGAVADAALSEGGEVIGVIPTTLMDAELAHPGLTSLEVVAGMHERKARMERLADGFVALPGGCGTLDEIFEAWTWQALGYHDKPVGFFNPAGYWDRLLAAVDGFVADGLVRAKDRDSLIVAESVDALLGLMDSWRPVTRKWMELS